MAGHIGDMKSQHWNTPTYILEAVRGCFGGRIQLDPCDNEWSTTDAIVSYKLPKDGLKESWLICPNDVVSDGMFLHPNGHVRFSNVFCNPPYGLDKERHTSIADWIEKAHDTYRLAVKEGLPMEIVLLIPASTETDFWFDYIWSGARAICFIHGRVSHPLEGKKSAGSTKGSALVYWGNDVPHFEANCRDLGRVVIL